MIRSTKTYRHNSSYQRDKAGAQRTGWASSQFCFGRPDVCLSSRYKCNSKVTKTIWKSLWVCHDGLKLGLSRKCSGCACLLSMIGVPPGPSASLCNACTLISRPLTSPRAAASERLINFVPFVCINSRKTGHLRPKLKL